MIMSMCAFTLVLKMALTGLEPERLDEQKSVFS